MVVKKFRGLIVKRMRRVPGGILLTLLGRMAGQRGKQLLISQADWDDFGSTTYEKNISLAALRRSQPAE